MEEADAAIGVLITLIFQCWSQISISNMQFQRIIFRIDDYTINYLTLSRTLIFQRYNIVFKMHTKKFNMLDLVLYNIFTQSLV